MKLTVLIGDELWGGDKPTYFKIFVEWGIFRFIQ